MKTRRRLCRRTEEETMYRCYLRTELETKAFGDQDYRRERRFWSTKEETRLRHTEDKGTPDRGFCGLEQETRERLLGDRGREQQMLRGQRERPDRGFWRTELETGRRTGD